MCALSLKNAPTFFFVFPHGRFAAVEVVVLNTSIGAILFRLENPSAHCPNVNRAGGHWVDRD
jgi:hypothetical protein